MISLANDTITKTIVLSLAVAALTALWLISASATAKSYVVTDGLISYWTCNKADITGDNVKDVWGGQDATMQGGPKIIDGKFGNALEFNGTTDYLLITDDIKAAKLPKREMTAEVWVYPKHFIEWGGYLGAFQDNGGFEKGWVLGTYWQFSFAVSTDGANDGDGILTYLKAPAFDMNQWYHVVGTYDGKMMTIYVNGKPEGTSDVQSGDIHYPDNLFFILGVYKDDNENFPHMGMLDEVRLYDRALSEDEVLQNYEAEGLAVNPAGKLSLTWGGIKR